MGGAESLGQAFQKAFDKVRIPFDEAEFQPGIIGTAHESETQRALSQWRDSLRLRELTTALDCLSEQDFCLLCDIELGTAEAWRKRHKGPMWIRMGNRVVYPMPYLRDWMRELGEKWRGTDASRLL